MDNMEFGVVNEKVEEKRCKVVSSPAEARKLIRLGNRVIDIKEHRDHNGKTVFVFDADEKFLKDYAGMKK